MELWAADVTSRNRRASSGAVKKINSHSLGRDLKMIMLRHRKNHVRVPMTLTPFASVFGLDAFSYTYS